MNVANSVTYLSQDFKLQGGKVGNGGADFNGPRVIRCSVFVEKAGDLIEVAADPAVLGCQLPDSGKKFVLTADTWTTGRMVARRIACRRNSDWLIP